MNGKLFRTPTSSRKTTPSRKLMLHSNPTAHKEPLSCSPFFNSNRRHHAVYPSTCVLASAAQQTTHLLLRPSQLPVHLPAEGLEGEIQSWSCSLHQTPAALLRPPPWGDDSCSAAPTLPGMDTLAPTVAPPWICSGKLTHRTIVLLLPRGRPDGGPMDHRS